VTPPLPLFGTATGAPNGSAPNEPAAPGLALPGPSGQNREVPHDTRPARPGRVEPREISELRALKSQQPELASAVAMQIELVELQRRMQARMSTPFVQHDAAFVEGRMRRGERLVDFSEVHLEWSDFRLVFRQTADVLRRYEVIDSADHSSIQLLARDGDRLQELTRDYYARTPRPDATVAPDPRQPGMLDQVLAVALRPFLARCADVWMTRLDPSEWNRSWCLICGGEPDFAVLPAGGDRWLICGRCTAQWPFGTACPFCGNDVQGGITSFASRDGRYRVYGCNECRKYLKAYDARGSGRPVIPAVDTIATLPLDAAAIQRGYDG
jgi:hypothetical protein